MFNFSTLFTGEFISCAFDSAISVDAANGRVNATFRDALLGAYGLELPASPKAAVGYINSFIGADKAPKIGKGPGARTGARAVAQGLRALGQALHASGACKGLPTLAPLAAWADPAALAAARAAKAVIAKETAPDSAPTTKAARASLAVVRAALEHGLFTASECDALAFLAATCPRAPEKATKGATKGAKKATTTV